MCCLSKSEVKTLRFWTKAQKKGEAALVYPRAGLCLFSNVRQGMHPLFSSSVSVKFCTISVPWLDFFSFSILLPLLLFLSSLPFFSSCCGEVSPRCLAIKGLCAAAAVGSLQKLSSHSLRPLCDFTPHLCEQTLWALLRQSTPTTLQFFAFFFQQKPWVITAVMNDSDTEQLLFQWHTRWLNCMDG